jgi:hypothetical protein
MDTNPVSKPKIRMGKKQKFVVEEHVEAIQWPQECAACGKPAEVYDDNADRIGSFMNCYKVTPPRVPYCNSCFKKVKATKRLDTALLFIGTLFGIPAGLLLAYSFYLTLEKITKTEIMCLGLIAAIGFVAGVQFIRFLIRGPVKAIFKNRYTGYVEFDDKNIKLSDAVSTWFLEISIPNKLYAAKFAALNEVVPQTKNPR